SLIPKISYFGAAIGTIATEFIVAAYAVFLVLRKIRLRLSLLGVFKAALSVSLTTILSLELIGKATFVPWFVNAILIAVLYIATLYILGAVSKKDLHLLWSKKHTHAHNSDQVDKIY